MVCTMGLAFNVKLLSTGGNGFPLTCRTRRPTQHFHSFLRHNTWNDVAVLPKKYIFFFKSFRANGISENLWLLHTDNIILIWRFVPLSLAFPFNLNLYSPPLLNRSHRTWSETDIKLYIIQNLIGKKFKNTVRGNILLTSQGSNQYSAISMNFHLKLANYTSVWRIIWIYLPALTAGNSVTQRRSFV